MAPENSTPPRIWVLGRSPLAAETAFRALASTGEARLFTDGAALLAELERVQASGDLPDILVLDWQLPGTSALCRHIRQSPQPPQAAELPIIALTSSREPADLRATREAGATDFVLAPFLEEELSARVAAALEMKHLRALVRRTAAFREGFSGALGHDLRQPLSTLSMGASVLLTRNLAEADAKIVRRLHSATQRMTRMVADLFDLARAQVGSGISIERRPLDFNEACREVVEEARTANAGRSIVLEASGDGKGEWDRDRIQQACTNLIANALRHSEASAPIVVTAGGDADEVTLAVASRGPQIPDDVRATLFDPYRVGSGEGLDAKGAPRLGLFIVREIARGHGGTVRVDSDESQTVFSVQLPRSEAGHAKPASP